MKQIIKAKFTTFYHTHCTRQRGYMLIAGVLLYFFILVTGSMEIIVTNTILLQDADRRIAYLTADSQCQQTDGPISEAIRKQVYAAVQAALIEHAQQAKTGTAFSCQGVSYQGNNPKQVESQPAICDPIRLLDDLQGQAKQTLKDLDLVLPDHNQTHPEPIESQYRQIRRQFQNEYDYVLKPLFIGQQVAMAAGTKNNKGVSQNKTEQYRYLIRAEVTMRSYAHITYFYTFNYDLIIETQFQNATFIGGTDACDPGNLNTLVQRRPNTIKSCGGVQDSDGNYLYNCTTAGVLDGDTFCVQGTECYRDRCMNTQTGVDVCQQNVSSGCGDLPNPFVQTQGCTTTDVNGHTIILGTYTLPGSTVIQDIGCATQSTPRSVANHIYQRPQPNPSVAKLYGSGSGVKRVGGPSTNDPFSYTFINTIKMVGQGTNFD